MRDGWGVYFDSMTNHAVTTSRSEITRPTATKENSKMPMLHFHCPKTEKPVSTGVHMPDLTESLNLIRGHEAAVQCPYCGEQHEWQSDFAYFLEDDLERAGHVDPPCISTPLK
jgi:hypothetical protein